MDVWIVTGGSKGLGEAVVRELLAESAIIHYISRTLNETLHREASLRDAQLHYHAYDLADAAGIDGLMRRILQDGAAAGARAVTLLNNAGVLEPIGPVGALTNEDLQRSLQVNLLAPALLTNSFIQHTQGMAAVRRVVNVSSGAGKKPYAGWGSYCAAKAGLDMFTRAVGMEQAGEANGVRILAVAPGVIDTAMQQAIRETPEAHFPQRSRFERLHEEGQLQTPQDTARRLLRWLREGEWLQGDVVDLRDLPLSHIQTPDIRQ